jgi:predicted DNA-binding antitoxin AbrB/MazE fold protein
MKTVHAVFESGVFRPIEPVDLPEHSEVEFEPRVLEPKKNRLNGLAEIYKILGERYDSGDPFGAERHNEHQP